jgi:Spy/CpxP family protein refolding chaperone
MRNPRRLTMMLALSVMLAAGAMAAAQPGDGPGRGRRGEPGERAERGERGWSRFCERLALTEDQKQAITAIRTEGRQRQLETRKQIVQLEAKLHVLLLADVPDEAAAVALVRQIGDLRADQQADRVKLRLAIRKQLTPEQRTQFILMEGRGPRGHERGRPGPGRGPR